MSREGTFTAGSNPPQDVRLLADEFDEPEDIFGRVEVHRAGWRLELRRSEVPVQPAEGDLCDFDDLTLRVRAVYSDPHELLWLCDCDLVVAEPGTVLEPAMLPLWVGPVWMT